MGVETYIHLTSPIQNGGTIGEIDVGRFDNTLFLVVVERGYGNVATDVDPLGGDVNTVGDKHRGENDTSVLLDYLVGKKCFVVDRRRFVTDGSEGDLTSLHARFIVEGIVIGETAASGVIDSGAWARDGFAFYSDGVEGR